MTQVVCDIIKIEGWDKNWFLTGLSLRQVYNDHHVFELSVLVPQPPVYKDKSGGPALTQEALLNIIGKNAQITICATEKNNATCEFTGFVDQVVPVWTSRACMLRITGYSPTLFMDCGPRFRTFYKKPLSEIVRKIMGNYQDKMELPSLNGAGLSTDFSVQTQETDYRYLCRLADGYGKVFYYDGTQLHFGDLENKKDQEKAIPLEFEEDLKQANFSLNIAPLNFNLSAYQVESGKMISHAVANKNMNNAPLIHELIRKSTVYPTSALHLFNLAENKTELETKSQRLLAKQAHDLVRLTGVSDLPSLKIGSKIAIKDTKEMISQGEFIVIEVNHSVSNDFSYSNTFTAVPAGYPFPVRMQNARSPLCGPLMAIVKDHADPQQLGRVRVEFIGDEEKTLSPWLRVLMPYTGNGGMYFLPETGDEVVVQSEDFNIEKFPFITGAFYQGKAPANKWYDPKNKKKGFTTEKVAFQIDDRTGKLTIEAEEIEIIARKKMKTEAEEAEFIGKKNMKINGGRHLTQEADRIDLNP